VILALFLLFFLNKIKCAGLYVYCWRQGQKMHKWKLTKFNISHIYQAAVQELVLVSKFIEQRQFCSCGS